jgi:glycine cleavage system H protein
MNLPKNLKYTEYLWVKKEGNTATVGVTDYGLKQAKEIMFIDLPKKDKAVKKGEELFSLESAKWSGHLESPVTGKVTEVNESLFDEPEKLNKDPYSNWVCKIGLDKAEELDSLMDASGAEKWVKENLE